MTKRRSFRFAVSLLLIGLILGIGQFFVTRTERDIAEYQRCMNAQQSLLSAVERRCATDAETTWYGAPFSSAQRFSRETIINAGVFILPPALFLFFVTRPKSSKS